MAFEPTSAPRPADVAAVVAAVGERVRELLERRGLLADEADVDEAPNGGDQLLLQCASVRPLAEERVARLARPGRRAERSRRQRLCARWGGFEVHAGVLVAARDRRGLERLCRYLARPPVPQDRVRIEPDGRVRFELKRTRKNGVRALTFDPLAFIARLAALVPPPGVHLLRYYGVLASHHRLRARVVPRPPDPKRVKRPIAPKRPGRMSWADLLARVWLIDALRCRACGGTLRIVSAILEPRAIEAILAALACAARPG